MTTMTHAPANVEATPAVDVETLLAQLAVIARRAAQGGGTLPPDMAKRLQELADAARNHTPVVEHPAWCDPAECISETEHDGTLSVGHRRTLLEEYESGTRKPGEYPTRVVAVARYDNYLPDGRVVSEGAHMFLATPTYGEFTGADIARRYARAVAVAGELVAGDVLPAGCTHLP